jgi:type III pantothenate kinase
MSAARSKPAARRATPGRTLLVDIGNTRVKWAVLARGRLGRQQAAAHEGWGGERIARHVIANGSRATQRRPARELPGRVGRGRASNEIDRLVVVSVAGTPIDRAFTAEVKRRLGIAPEFFRSARRAGGVTTLYAEPWRLGADRLAGVIGAFDLSKHRPVCVVSVGTTMTLELVDARGRHRGGAIVPAPALMVASLLAGTAGIQRRARGGAGGSGLYARSTRVAIGEGTRYAAAAVADRAVAEARAVLGHAPQVLLTGGAAPFIRKLIRTPHRYVPDLVLRGLAVIASARPLGTQSMVNGGTGS